jgi:hypothetical protein
MPMEKLLWEPNVTTVFATMPQETGTMLDDTSIGVLYRQFFVDESRLLRRIETMLETRPACTLAELLDIYPAEKGISELIAYLAIASHDERHIIDRDVAESVVLPAGGALSKRTIAMPRIVFRSAYES